MKIKKEDLPDIRISNVNFYGENLDFFFMAASITRAETVKNPKRPGKKRNLVSLKPEKL